MRAKALILGGAAALLIAGAAGAQQTRTADPLAALPRAVTMVLSDSLMLVEEAYGVTNSRSLKIGEEYRDGWKLEAVTATSATLRKGNETRTVAFAGGAAAAGAPVAAETGLTAKTTLTNAVAGERTRIALGGANGPRKQRTTAPPDRARIQKAMADGNVEEVYLLGASAAEVAQMLGANGGPMADILASGGQASFVDLGGRTGVQVSSTADDGRARNIVMVPPQLQGVAPPADATVMTPPPVQPGAQVSSDGQGNTIIRRSIAVPAPGN